MLDFWKKHPLYSILLLGAVARLPAAYFSAGYAMHDDHFLVVEVAQSWADGGDVYGWITSDKASNSSGRSLFYPGIVAALFWMLDLCGLNDPGIKMLLLRLLQALYSLLSVYYAFKIVRHYAGDQCAREAGLLTALLWLMPYISVRTLAEVVCIPPLLAATWVLVNPKYAGKRHWALWAGALIGIGFSLRYQTILYGAGLAIALLWQCRRRETAWFMLGALAEITFVHGWVEWYVWGYPFGKIEYYVRYNLAYKDAYFHHPWYNYLLLLPGLLFPVGLLYAWGTLRYGYRYLPLFLGLGLFVLFHSMMPNKQERFIFSIVPMFIALGALGWNEWLSRSTWRHRRARLLRGLWAFFWALNLPALLVFSTYYPKQGKVEALLGLRNVAPPTAEAEWIVVADGRKERPDPVPLFYTGRRPGVLYFGKNSTPEGLAAELLEKKARPEWVFVLENERTEAVESGLKAVFPDMRLLKTHEANRLDRFLHRLNPLNRTEGVRVFAVRPET